MQVHTAGTENLSQLRSKIRWGEEPNNPLLISRWLAQENSAHQAACSREYLRQCYESQFTLLLETLVDELIPAHWRCMCLDNIHRPLQSLKQISDTPQSNSQIQRLARELAVQSHYVRHSLKF